MIFLKFKVHLPTRIFGSATIQICHAVILSYRVTSLTVIKLLHGLSISNRAVAVDLSPFWWLVCA